ncbi:phosphomannomutase CpsG [Oleispirillum naphthae]|uniref:phosphomannomutase CpsG n=1 Tax=Oleispirillum naphthae TaxID=2838853 RepID=UPI0030826069
MTLSCFKAYDIRGEVPATLDAAIARRIGRAFAEEIRPGATVVGRDARLESPELAAALIAGLAEGGSGVVDIGLCATEEVYFQTAHREKDGVGGGIMVTASHNPKGHNGMKLVRSGARPISGDSGLAAIRARTEAAAPPPAVKPGQVVRDADRSAYIDHLLGYVDADALSRLTIVADAGNGCAGPIVAELAQRLPCRIVPVRCEPDGDFPDGIPNPLLPEMREATAQAVRAAGADLGVAWDGDADRCFLYDADGNFIEGYYLVGLLACALLQRHPGAKIVHDPRLEWNTIAEVTRAGGVPVRCKTGHAFIKERMRAEDAVYGGEMSGHHYFRDFAYCDSGMIPWLLVAGLIGRSGRTLAELVGERIAAFPCSGEVNFQTDAAATTQRILARYLPQGPRRDDTDGVSLEFADWRFNLRRSNTEPLLRLNIESRGDAAAVARHLAEISHLIGGEP